MAPYQGDKKKLEKAIVKGFSTFITHISDTEKFAAFETGTKPIAIFVSPHRSSNIPMSIKSIAHNISTSGFQSIHFHSDSPDLLTAAKLNSELHSDPKASSLSVKLNDEIHTYTSDVTERLKAIEWLLQFAPVLSDSESGKATSESASAGSELNSKATVISTLTVTVDNFEEKVIKDTDSTYLVAVVAADAAIELGEVWKSKLSKASEGVLKVAELRCGSGEEESKAIPPASAASKLCKKFSASGSKAFLSVIPFGPSSRTKLSTSVSGYSYESDEFDTARARALESLPEKAVWAVDESTFNNFLSSAMQESILPVVIVSLKSAEPPSFLLNLALSNKKIAKIGFLSSPSQQFLSQIGNPSLPTAIVVLEKRATEDGETQGYIQFYSPEMFGALKFKGLQRFVVESYELSGLKDRVGGGGGDDDDDDVDAGRRASLTEVKTESDWDRHCGTTFKGICSIGFFDGTEYMTDKNFGDQMKIYSKGISAMGSAANAFKFLWVNTSCQSAFSDKFDVQETKLPIVIAYSPSKERVANQRTAFSDKNIKDFLVSVISGQFSTRPLSQRPVIAGQCDEVIQPIPVDPEQDADAEDFLAEIQREEAEKAQRLKQELADEKKRAEEEQRKTEEEKSKKKKKKKKKGKKKGSSSEL